MSLFRIAPALTARMRTVKYRSLRFTVIMTSRSFVARSLVASLLIGSLSVGCGDDDGATPGGGAHGFTVGGTIAGLVGTGLVLQNSAGDDLAVTPNGTGADRFDFRTALATGAPFAVTVKTQPGAPAQTCTVANGAGAVASAAVTNVAITCGGLRTVSARVVGLDTGRSVVLQNNGRDDLAFAAEGTQAFATTIASGGAYSVTVLSQPSGGSCLVAEGSGTVGAEDVVVEVSCPRNVFVDAVAGLDTNVGSAAAPWKTITHAIASMPVAGGTIQLAPGIYSQDSGERFPLEPRSNQTILGDVATRGASATPTVIRGAGGYTPAAGDLGKFPSPFTYSVIFTPGVTGAAVKGVAFATTDSYAFLADGASVSLDSDYVMTGAGFAGNGAQVTITNSALGGPEIVLVVVDPTTTLKLRGTTLSGG